MQASILIYFLRALDALLDGMPLQFSCRTEIARSISSHSARKFPGTYMLEVLLSFFLAETVQRDIDTNAPSHNRLWAFKRESLPV